MLSKIVVFGAGGSFAGSLIGKFAGIDKANPWPTMIGLFLGLAYVVYQWRADR
jgi:hypothetical protein